LLSYLLLNIKNIHFISLLLYIGIIGGGRMLERSQNKHKILDLLQNWNYTTERATVWNIAKKAECSVSTVQAIMRFYESIGVAESHRGSWVLV
jgi:hypothetical protein